jgi:diguanylate cyclase (GGDEF)-like protein
VFTDHSKLTDKQIQQVVELLEIADKNHRNWLSNLHTSIVCQKPFDEDVFAENAHRCCVFGSWYYNDSPDLLRSREEFQALEPAHKVMHDAARKLALIIDARQPVDESVYQDFINKQRFFSSALLALRDRLCECLYSFDALTGLMTRQPFALILESEYARIERTGNSSCVVLIDIDHFKSVNDDYGHLVGDRVLCEVAQFIRSNIRPYDSVCRYGGEEFLLILPNTDQQECHEIIDRLRQDIANFDMHSEDNKVFHITVSAGISLLNDKQQETSIGHADKALYEAKNSGRNKVCYCDVNGKPC